MYPMVSCGWTWAVLSVSFRNFSLTTMFLWEEDSPPPLLLTPSSPLPRSPCSFSSWVGAAGASVGELSLTELESDDDDGEEEGGVSWWVGLVLNEGAGPVAGANRGSGGSGVRVEIQASNSTVSSSREPNSSVTSSPTPSIRAIAHGNAHWRHTGNTPAHRWRRKSASTPDWAPMIFNREEGKTCLRDVLCLKVVVGHEQVTFLKFYPFQGNTRIQLETDVCFSKSAPRLTCVSS